MKWDPAVGSTCGSIWVDPWYCVGVPGTATARPSATLTTPTPTVAPTGVQTPSPIREGMTTTCNKFHFVVKDENCDTLVTKYGSFTLAQFLSWDPAVGSNCGGLWADTWFCVGVPGTAPPTTTKPSTTLATSTRPALSTWSMLCILKFMNGQYYCVGKLINIYMNKSLKQNTNSVVQRIQPAVTLKRQQTLNTHQFAAARSGTWLATVIIVVPSLRSTGSRGRISTNGIRA